MRHPSVAGLILMLGAVLGAPATADTLDELLDVDAARAKAMIAADPEALGQLLHAEVTFGHSNGRTDTRATMIDKLVSGRVAYEIIDSTAPSARRIGDTGIVTGPVSLRVRAGERILEMKSIFTAVYVRIDGRWQLVAYHSSPVRS